MPTEQRARTSKRSTRAGRLEVAVVCGVLAACAALCAGVAWSRPLTTPSVIAYTQSGHLSYAAPASATSIYGTAGVTTGQPVYANAVQKLNVTYSYDIESSAVVELAGTAQLVATIDNGQGIVRRIPLQPTTAVKGTRFAVHRHPEPRRPTSRSDGVRSGHRRRGRRDLRGHHFTLAEHERSPGFRRPRDNV